MADIAMLVAEEYERRIRNSTKAGAHAQSGEMDLFSSLSVLAGVKSSTFGEEKKKMEPLKLKPQMEPKTRIALAAIDGFFSA